MNIVYSTFRKDILPYLFLLALLLPVPISTVLNAQQLDRVQGEILVQFKEGVDAVHFMQQYRSFRGRSTQARVNEKLQSRLEVYSMRFDWTRINEFDFLAELRQHPLVQTAQFNHLIQLRNTPNDPLYTSQWHLFNTGQDGGTTGVDMDMDLAWDVTTGGLTPAGDTIVVCIIDNGMDLTHEDFQDNRWVNHLEIPDNGIDDDGNGFVDDYEGWNVSRKNDQISEANFHGTPIAGIIGAKGNNGIGVTGMNWNVKLMVVVGGFGQFLESRIIEAYSYALEQRRLYNETGGEKGAFVVATNSSWGFDESKPDDYPLWCAVFDTLGQQGILNVGATSNRQVDVDSLGDMPTSCTSDYLLTVTNTDNKGRRVLSSGFGKTSIDMGAFGDGVYTTDDGNRYGFENGTSFAAPMATGAIGLLYSTDCPTLSVLSQVAPGEAALLAKDILMRSTDPEPTLDGLTVTGGRLNMNNAIQLLLSECGSCPPVAAVQATDITDTAAEISWVRNDSINRTDLRWRIRGENQWTLLEDVQSPLSFTDLLACTTYEYQIRGVCSSGAAEFELTYSFKTDGCCEAPFTTELLFVGNSDALITWDGILAANDYEGRYRVVGTTEWTTQATNTKSLPLRDLDECTDYEVQLRSNCSDEISGYGSSIFFRTLGCGVCIEGDYCIPVSLDESNAGQEWIANIQLAELNNSSTRNGYGDFTESVMGPSLKKGETYEIRLEPGFESFSFNEYFQVWIDFNQDAVFTSDEVVVDPGGVVDTVLISSIQIPAEAELGSTRMRVIMQFRDQPVPCSFTTGFFGEVEDYCVDIVDSVSTVYGPAPLASQLTVFPNPATDQVQYEFELEESADNIELEVYDMQGRQLQTSALGRRAAGQYSEKLDLSALNSGVYFLRLRSGNRFSGTRLVIL